MQSGITINQQHRDHATIIQITDTHIQADPDDNFDGVNTRDSLHEVLKFIREHEGPYDAMLVTGDLVHDPVEEAYLALFDQLKNTGPPVFCIPGNHDAPDLMEKHLNARNVSTIKNLQLNHWQICMLNTWLPGTHAGELPTEELRFLENSLCEHDGKHALLVLHHPPVSIDSPWMDRMGLNNPDDFFSIIDQYKEARAVIWGHIHQAFDETRNDVRLLATPSTCVQFMPHAPEYRKDDKSPGYRVLKLLNDGRIKTVVKRPGQEPE